MDTGAAVPVSGVGAGAVHDWPPSAEMLLNWPPSPVRMSIKTRPSRSSTQAGSYDGPSAGCTRCDELESRVFTSLSQMDMSADVEHVRDIKEIAAFGPTLPPALVINGKVAVAGQVPSVPELSRIIAKYAKEDIEP